MPYNDLLHPNKNRTIAEYSMTIVRFIKFDSIQTIQVKVIFRGKYIMTGLNADGIASDDNGNWYFRIYSDVQDTEYYYPMP
jgi:hypothetical protein